MSEVLQAVLNLDLLLVYIKPTKKCKTNLCPSNTFTLTCNNPHWELGVKAWILMVTANPQDICRDNSSQTFWKCVCMCWNVFFWGFFWPKWKITSRMADSYWDWRWVRLARHTGMKPNFVNPAKIDVHHAPRATGWGVMAKTSVTLSVCYRNCAGKTFKKRVSKEGGRQAERGGNSGRDISSITSVTISGCQV